MQNLGTELVGYARRSGWWQKIALLGLAGVLAAGQVLAQNCLPPPAGLVSSWQGEGNAFDPFGGNNGLALGGVGYATGKVGQAFSFNGANQYVQIPASTGLNPVGSFSIEAWIYPLPVSGAQVIVGKWGDTADLSNERSYILVVVPGAALQFDISDAANQWNGGFQVLQSTNNAVPFNAWSHVAATYNQSTGTRQLFLNGALLAQRTDAPITIMNAPNPISIGAAVYGTGDVGDYFSGRIDEVSFYNQALTGAQVGALYAAGSAGKCLAPAAPVFTVQPQSLALTAGQTAAFSASVSGSGPVTYQWWFNGATIAGATNATLTIPGVQATNAGVYNIVASNPIGQTTSSNAVLAVNVGSCASVTTGMISWWAAEGNAADQNGNNTGVLKNGATFAAGEVGGAFSFNGQNQYVFISNSASLNPAGSFSIEAWVNPRPTGGNQVILGKWGDTADLGGERAYILALVGANQLQFDISDAANQGNGPFQVFNTPNNVVPYNTWSHVAAVYNQSTGTRSIYVNGAAVAQRTDAPITVLNAGNPVSIGAGVYGTGVVGDYFSGQIDELSLYGRALAPADVLAIYTAGALGKCLVPLAPWVITSPQSLSVVAGGTAAFSVAAAGTGPFGYQWWFNSAPLAGANAATLSLTNVLPVEAGAYAVVVTNAVGSVTSAVATLTVTLQPPTILVQPGGGNVLAGSSPTLSVVANSSAPLAYQWYWAGTPIPGAVAANYTVTNVEPPNAGAYYVVVTNVSGSVQSSNAVLTVIGTPPGIVAQPRFQGVGMGGSALFQVSATGSAPLAYQWLWAGAPVAGATGSSLQLTNVQLAAQGDYSVAITNWFGTITSQLAGLTVTQTVCASIVNGLTGWWPAEGNAGDVVGGNNGSLIHGAGFAPGLVGQAFNFNGTNQYVAIPNSPGLDPTGSFTIEAWVYPQPSATAQVILGKWGDTADYAGKRCYNLAILSGNVLQFSISDSTNQNNTTFQVLNSANNAVPYNTWSHVAAVYNQATGIRQIYVNGVLVAQRTDHPITILQAANPVGIGAGPYGSTSIRDFFNGRIDELAFFNRALSAGEVQAVFNAGNLGKCPVSLPPAITSQPAGGTFGSWSNATLAAGVAGSPPFAYQWQFNGAPLPGATNALLALSNLSVTNSGLYSLVVTNLYGSATSSNAVITVTPPPSLLFAGSVTATSAVVVVPVNLVAQGTENGLGFSVDFNPSFLTFAGITTGSGVGGASALFNTNAATAGRVGALIALPGVTTLAAGTQEVAEISFFVNSGTNPVTTTVSFGDVPTARQVSDALANPLPSAFASGTVTIPWLGYEGDVAPLPNGDGVVTIIDWVQEGRYVAGLDTITNAAEFQRADTAPRSTFGDGQLTVADWVQTGRYAAGLDALTVAGGPTTPANGPVSSKKSGAGSYGPLGLGRTVLLAPTNAYPGQAVTVPVLLISQGNENAVGLSLKYDPTQLLATNIALGAGDSGATLVANLNRASNGVVGFLLSLPFGTAFTAGTQEVARITYFVQPGAVSPAPLVFTNSPTASSVSDPLANALTTTFQGASLVVASLTPPTLQATWTPTALTLAWPVNALGYTLQTSTNLLGTNWTTVSVSPVSGAVNQSVTLPIVAEPQRYYRLQHP